MTERRSRAWTEAPLPKQLDLELAKELVARGVYASLEEAYIEVSPEKMQEMEDLKEKYARTFQRPKAWLKAPLPKEK